MQLLDSRRLTGPNILWDRPGAVIDVSLPLENSDPILEAWGRQARRILDAIGWRHEQIRVRAFPAGASLALSAPVDALYAATEVNEWAWSAALSILSGQGEPDPEEGSRLLRPKIESERNPGLLALRDAAREHGVAFLSDDQTASVGLGSGSREWPVTALPAPEQVDWTRVHDIPVVLVTGTNGKTTTVRLVGAMVAAAGKVTGLTTTDGVHVAGEAVAAGDYSGPEGARTVLRDRRVETAILETARGGILRRGLAVRSADAAIVTNVADDHLGEFGIHDLRALAECKMVVGSVVKPSGRLVLNAGDPTLVAAARSPAPIAWFGLDPAGTILAERVEAGGEACFLEGGIFTLARVGRKEAVLPVIEAPLTLGGAARHNVVNALGALAVASALGLPVGAMASGLRNFRGGTADNPGRGNRFDLGGVGVLVEFAHNPHSFRALFETAAALSAKRRLILLGHAGDRTDESIRELARVAWRSRPDRVVIKEMPEYLRGRAEGEIPALMEAELRRLGAPPEAIDRAGSELEGVRRALRWARAGDLLLLTIHAQREEVLRLLQRLEDRGWAPGQEP